MRRDRNREKERETGRYIETKREWIQRERERQIKRDK